MHCFFIFNRYNSVPIDLVRSVWQKTGIPAFEIVVELYNLYAS